MNDLKKQPVVLLIDDDVDVLMMIEGFFVDSGYTVVAVVNGVAGVRAGYECRPDIIVTEVKMPKMDGLEMLQKLWDKGICPPSIALSGSYGLIESLLEEDPGKRRKSEYVMSKPVNFLKVIKKNDEILQLGKSQEMQVAV